MSKAQNGVGVLFYYVTPACDAFIDETRRREGKTRSQWFRHLLTTHYNRPDLATMPDPDAHGQVPIIHEQGRRTNSRDRNTRRV
jgi:hypothetical protein